MIFFLVLVLVYFSKLFFSISFNFVWFGIFFYCLISLLHVFYIVYFSLYHYCFFVIYIHFVFVLIWRNLG